MGLLVITRHAESEWNLLGTWTGITDVSITKKGAADAIKIGELLQDVRFSSCYVSDLKRTHETLDGILAGCKQQGLAMTIAPEIQERDYGELTGKNKWQVLEEVGEDAFNGIRRGWDYPVPGGETLKDVYARVLPYFTKEILPKLQDGQTLLMVAHGNSIRALMKHLEQIPEENMATVEMPFGQILLYTFDNTHELPVSKEIRQADITATHA